MSDDVYSNELADEFLPGIMYPFHWSVLAGITDAGWNQIRRDLGVEGEDLQFVRTFYHRAYWNLTKIMAVLKQAAIPQTIIDRLFEPPTSRSHSLLDEASADRVLAIDRSSIAQDLELAILESERHLEEGNHRWGEWETEEELIREIDMVLGIIGEVLFRETAAWLLVGLNLSVLDEWTGHQQEGTSKRYHDETAVVPWSRSKIEEVRSMAIRCRSYWDHSRSVNTLGRRLAEERLLALGGRFVKWSLLSTPEDVRYLTVHEVRQIISGGCSTNTCNNYSLRARVRRSEIDQHIVEGLPQVIRGETAPPLPWGKDEKHASHF